MFNYYFYSFQTRDYILERLHDLAVTTALSLLGRLILLYIWNVDQMLAYENADDRNAFLVMLVRMARWLIGAIVMQNAENAHNDNNIVDDILSQAERRRNLQGTQSVNLYFYHPTNMLTPELLSDLDQTDKEIRSWPEINSDNTIGITACDFLYAPNTF